MLYVKIEKEDGFEYEKLDDYCKRISKKNNASLYHLEKFLGMKLNDNEQLSALRNTILDTSGDISRLADSIVIVSDDNERL